MVCKENVVSWFGKLSSYKRIDVMCTLLNMCLPFEVRYLGTYVEDRGKRDYNDLRDTEHHANNVTDLVELASLGVTDTRTRRKLVLYIALLQGCNYASANILFKCLTNLDIQEVINTVASSGTAPNEQQPLEELLLLYTMALSHPAFTYEQKTSFGNIYLKLQEEEARQEQPKPLETFNYKTNERLGTDTLDFGTSCPILPPVLHYPDIPGRKPETGVPPGWSRAEPPGLSILAPDQPSIVPPGWSRAEPPGLSILAPDQTSIVPPGWSRAEPPGLSILAPDQTSIGPGPYLHVGFPPVNSVGPWSAQAMMAGNQMMYSSSDMPAYPASPLVSRQSSPSQSRSPSRSNSPTTRRNTMRSWSNNFEDRTSSQTAQPTSNTMTTSISNISNSQTSSSSTSSHGSSRNVNCGPTRSAPPSTCASSSYLRQKSLDNTSTITNHQPPPPPPPPPRLRASCSGDSLRETIGKETPNLKSNLQNFSLEDMRRMSDDDLRDFGITQLKCNDNSVGQSRNMALNQSATNGLSQVMIDKNKAENPGFMHQVVEQSENEAGQGLETSSENSNTKVPPQLQDLHQPMHHHHHPTSVTGMRRYMPHSVESPAQMSMYHSQPPMFATQNPCYACLTVPTASMQNRYSRCNAQHVYCLTHIQALRLDSDNNRYCSQSSSSDSTGSRSPPETPPAAPWTNSNPATSTADNCTTTSGVSTSDHIASSSNSTAPYSSVVSVSHQNSLSSIQQQIHERPRSKKHQTHMLRQKSQMINGSSSGSAAVLSNMPHCVSAFPGPTSHPQMPFLPHGHFPSIRPNSGIYSTGFSPSMYSRSAFPPNYQPNGEIMYTYPAGAAGGTPPPPPPPPPSTATVSVGVTPSAYIPPVLNYTLAPTVQTKISCYNCGSSSHLAVDCKDQTMEDLTKRAQYRLDYTVMKQPGESSHTDE